ncbi:hypothetical protein [Solidesulfovibrio sp. C21]|uniref:hypothetical protein n=1 Tax=Solidesulfovibrio sp. C21 TaxID=3398613 RepID=UPI0039FC321B
MAAFVSRKHPVPCFTSLVAIVFFAVALSGCATPTTTTKRFDSFATVTSDLGTQVINAYSLENAIKKKVELLDFVQNYENSKNIFDIKLTSVADDTLYTRQMLILGLVTYASTLKNIMNDEPINTFTTNAEKIGTELGGIKTTLESSGIFSNSISPKDIGNAIVKIGDFLMRAKRREYVKKELSGMNTTIGTIVEFLKNDIGDCSTGTYGGIRYFCIENSVTVKNNISEKLCSPGAGIGARYCTGFGRLNKLYQFSMATTPKKGTTAPQLSGDQQKVASQFASLAWKMQDSCIFLQNVKKSLDAYAAAHKKLSTAFDKRSGALAEDLQNLAAQIVVENKLYESATAN